MNNISDLPIPASRRVASGFNGLPSSPPSVSSSSSNGKRIQEIKKNELWHIPWSELQEPYYGNWATRTNLSNHSLLSIDRSLASCMEELFLENLLWYRSRLVSPDDKRHRGKCLPECARFEGTASPAAGRQEAGEKRKSLRTCSLSVTRKQVTD